MSAAAAMNLGYGWFILKLCAYRKMNHLRILESTREARVNPYAAFVLSLYFLSTLYLDSRTLTDEQRAKKVVSDSPRLVDFAVELVNSVINLPHGQVKFF